MFYELMSDELDFINGGADAGTIVAGGLFFAVGVGCLAIAAVPGVNVVAAAAVAYAGSWGLAGGITTTIIGICK